jgi:adenylate cyclase
VTVAEVQRRLSAILFTDMVDSSRVTGADEQAGLRLRDRHRVLVRDQVERHRGRLIEAPGDETLSTFDSALDAVNAALAIRASLASEPGLSLHIGAHLGETIFRGDEVFGDGVNIAARIRAIAAPGEILVSGEVAGAVRNRPEIVASPRGEHALKNVDRPVSVFEISGTPSHDEDLAMPARRVGAQPSTPRPGDRASRWSGRWRAAAALVVVSIAAALAPTWDSLREWLGVAAGAPKVESLAVLPLENLSGDPKQEYFADGMTEALIAELSKISALRVISRTSVMRYKGSEKALPQVARELGVDAVIEGSVVREGETVRISVQLIDGASDRHLWTQSFDRELRSILALHRDVAQAVAREIAVALTPQERTQLEPARAVDPRAYELYVLGRHHTNQRTIGGYRRAAEVLRQALSLDANYAPAHAALADVYMLLGEQGGLQRQDARSLAADAIREALARDPNLAEAYTSLGIWKLHYEWNWEASERAFQRALALSPGYSAGHQRYGRSLGFVGRYDEALRSLHRARELDPLSVPVNAYLGQIYLFARRYQEAERELRKALELDPNHPLTHHNLGELYLAQGRIDAAVGELEESVARSGKPTQSHYLAVLGWAYARAHRRREATEILEELNRRYEQGLTSEFDLAGMQMALGDAGGALDWLERGYQERDYWLVEAFAWPWFDALRGDERFKSLQRRTQLSQ